MPKQIPHEALTDLKRRLDSLPARSHERRILMAETAKAYGVSEKTLYRQCQARLKPSAVKRSDHGIPRVTGQDQMELYCEVIAAIRIKTTNKKGRHLSTAESIRLLEEFGVDSAVGFIKAPPGLLNKTTVNRYLKLWGYSQSRLSRQPPAVRFQAEHSNDCWHFDLSPSDLKSLEKPLWMSEGRGKPTLMLYSVVDDRSGVSYQEYRCVYGEDVEGALRFLFNAMAPKDDGSFHFQGIPKMIYADNGPISRSRLFLQVMDYLGIQIKTHLPRGKDGNRVTARSKGKVERPFRTVKDVHETLYHFHKPESENQANQWLKHFLQRYNSKPHRSENHSRLEDWLQNRPSSGLQAMCSWEKFCSFAREPEERKVAIDATVSIEGAKYKVSPELSGERVMLWWGLLDQELFVELDNERFGPFFPDSGPIPLHRYRNRSKTLYEKKAEKIKDLAESLSLPKDALDRGLRPELSHTTIELKSFEREDPFKPAEFSSAMKAKKAISDHLKLPLAKLSHDMREQINIILAKTLRKEEVIQQIDILISSANEKGKNAQ